MDTRMDNKVATSNGVYRHYKGGLYRVLFTAWMSDNGKPREEYVVYMSMEKGTINLRRIAEFHEPVKTDVGSVWRFTYAGEADPA